MGFGFQLIRIFIGDPLRAARTRGLECHRRHRCGPRWLPGRDFYTSPSKQPPQFSTGQPAMSMPKRLHLYEPVPSDARLTVIDKNLTERDFCRLNWSCRLDYVDSNIKGVTAAYAASCPVEILYVLFQTATANLNRPANSVRAETPSPIRVNAFGCAHNRHR